MKRHTDPEQRAALMHAVGREIDAHAVKRSGYGREPSRFRTLEFVNVNTVWIS